MEKVIMRKIIKMIRSNCVTRVFDAWQYTTTEEVCVCVCVCIMHIRNENQSFLHTCNKADMVHDTTHLSLNDTHRVTWKGSAEPSLDGG